MSNDYEYTVKNVYNAFGAGKCIRVTLLRCGKKVSTWEYDACLIPALGERRALNRIAKIEKIYGAVRSSGC